MQQAHMGFRYELQVQRAKLQSQSTSEQPSQTHDTWTQKIQQLATWQHQEPYQLALPTSFAIHDSCLWGTAHSNHLVQWLAQLRWESTPNTATAKIGTSWHELAFAYLTTTMAPIPINRGGAGPDFDPTLLYPTDPSVSFTEITLAFARSVKQLETLHGTNLVPPGRGHVLSLTYLGSKHGSKGITNRAIFPYQAQILKHLAAFFAAHHTHDHTSLATFPGHVWPLAPELTLFHEQDEQDKQNGWKTRFQRYCRALRQCTGRRTSSH